MRVGKETSAFLSTLDQRLFKRSRIDSDFRDRTFTLRCSRLRGEIPEPLLNTCKEAKSPAEHGRPSLEVRRCGDGHPPVTERERVIRLNGIGGVTFKTRIEKFDPGFSLKRSNSMSFRAKWRNPATSTNFELKLARQIFSPCRSLISIGNQLK